MDNSDSVWNSVGVWEVGDWLFGAWNSVEIGAQNLTVQSRSQRGFQCIKKYFTIHIFALIISISQSMNDDLKKFLLYTTPNGEIRVDVLLKDESVWLTQKAIAELFGVQRPAITKHLLNIFESKELIENSVSSILEHTAEDGKKYDTKFYNLDAIISVGYRVNSYKATQVRIWATQALKEYIIKGFVLDDNRLKQGSTFFGKDYFKELLQRVRSIRASERRIYQQVTDIFAECCMDYDKNAETTKNFYAMIQNKFHFAITGATAAEIIHL